MADVQFKFPRGAALRLYDNYARTSDPATSELTGLLKRTQNDAGLDFERELMGRVGALIDGQHTLHRYEDDALEAQFDRVEYRGGGGLFYRLFPKTDLIARYHHTRINYQDPGNSGDSQTQVIDAGLRGHLSPKIKALIVGGVQRRRYDQAAGAPPTERTGAYGLQLDWTATARLSVQVLANRSFQESIFASNRYYVSDGLKIGIVHHLGTKWILNGSGGFERATYPNASADGGLLDNRVDNRFYTSMELTYKIKAWLALGGGVLHRRQDSNFPLDYRNTVTSLTARLRL